jgi:branched-chain amino acid transport system permease protein
LAGRIKMISIISKLTTGWLAAAVVVVVLILLPVLNAPSEWILYAFLFFIYLAMSNMWNLLAGYTGLISLCQPAFLGIAGYALAIGTWVQIPWWAGIIGGAVLAGIFAILISFPVFRLSGVYFAIGTLVVPEALRLAFYLWKPVGGQLQGAGAGYMIKEIAGLDMSVIYWMACSTALLSAIAMRLILKSKLGLGLASIRDNERAAASCGVNTFWIKVYPFIISAVITGLAGAIFYVNQGYIEPSATFNVKWTMVLLLATVIGGMRTEGGPIIGTIIVVILYFVLARYAGFSLLIQGIILVVIMLISPQGIIGIVRNTRFYGFLERLANTRLVK